MMKFHWGHGISLAIVGFVGFMGYLAYRAFQVPSNLVREDYYEAGLDADSIKTTMRQGRALDEVSVLVTSEGIFLKNLAHQIDAGSKLRLETYCPSDPAGDWILEMEWVARPEFLNGNGFFIEKSVGPGCKLEGVWTFEDIIRRQNLQTYYR
jgi:hypothetical protein